MNLLPVSKTWNCEKAFYSVHRKTPDTEYTRIIQIPRGWVISIRPRGEGEHEKHSRTDMARGRSLTCSAQMPPQCRPELAYRRVLKVNTQMLLNVGLFLVCTTETQEVVTSPRMNVPYRSNAEYYSPPPGCHRVLLPASLRMDEPSPQG